MDELCIDKAELQLIPPESLEEPMEDCIEDELIAAVAGVEVDLVTAAEDELGSDTTGSPSVVDHIYQFMKRLTTPGKRNPRPTRIRFTTEKHHQSISPTLSLPIQPHRLSKPIIHVRQRWWWRLIVPRIIEQRLPSIPKRVSIPSNNTITDLESARDDAHRVAQGARKDLPVDIVAGAFEPAVRGKLAVSEDERGCFSRVRG